MSKMILKEEELQNIIQESIREVLSEENWLDKIAYMHQGLLNKYNNAKNRYDAARDFKRAENRTTDPYAQYYDSANTFTFNGQQVRGSQEFGDMIRSQGRGRYRWDRIGFLGDKYDAARRNYMNSDNFIGRRPSTANTDNADVNTNNVGLAPNPDIGQNINPNKKKKKKRKNKKNGGQQPPVQPQGGQTNP